MFKPPGILDLTNLSVNDFELWVEQFSNYLVVNKLNKEDDSLKIIHLKAVGGLELLKITKQLQYDENSLESLVSAIKRYLKPISNLVLERNKFFNMAIEPEEDIPKFVGRLKNQADLCHFADESVDTITNLLIRDQFLRGLKNTRILEFVLSQGTMNLETTVNKAESLKQAVKDAEALIKEEKPFFNLFQKDRKSFSRVNTREVTCFKCNKRGHIAKECRVQVCSTCKRKGHKSEQCYKNQKCHKCLKFGHTENICRKKGINSIFALQYNSDLPFHEARFEDFNCGFLVDTGATFSFLSRNFIFKNSLSAKLKHDRLDIKMADNRLLSIKESILGTLYINSKAYRAKFYIFDSHLDGILGVDLIKRIGLKFGSNPGLIFNMGADILSKHPKLFDQPLKNSVLKTIEPFEIIKLEPDAQPKQSVIREVPFKYREFLKNKIKELLENDVIEESISPFRSNVVIVPKSNDEFRLTINYKHVNDYTIFDSFPFPRIEELISRLAGAKVFSTLDFCQFYHQLELVESDRPKTAFAALGKLYQYKRCPFGLKNAVSYCGRLMGKLFEDQPNVLVYLDDLLVFSENEEQHREVLNNVLIKIQKANLTLNFKKCSFFRNSINFLGYEIAHGTIKPDSNRSQPIRDFPLPDSARSLQRFLGLATYYQKYIPNYSSLAHSLYNKLKIFKEWTDVEINKFERIKECIEKAILVIPKDEDELILRTDASASCISGVLETTDGKPVYFVSKTLNNHERNWAIIEKEAFAIFWSIKRLKNYLLGRKFVVYSDHKPLQFIFNGEKNGAKVLRWKLQLQEYNFEVRHCPGKYNVVADSLTRLNTLEVLPGERLITEDEIIKAQLFDNETKELVKAIKNRWRKKHEDIRDNAWRIRKILVVNDGVLETKDGRLFVPFSKRLKLLTVAHSSHLGFEQTIKNINSKFIFPSMSLSVKKFIERCRTCSLVKPKFSPSPSSPYLVKAPFETLAIDFVGPLPECKGFKYLFVAIDLFSRYPFVFPLKEMKTEQVIRCLKDIFTQFGFPDSILSDRGTQFESHEFVSFLKQFGVKKLTTHAFHPQGNGICERFNSTFKKLLKSYLTELDKSFSEWMIAINHSLLTYRLSHHSATQHRPVDLILNFNARGFLPTQPRSTISKKSAIENDLRYKEKNKAVTDKRAKERFFEKGEEVLIWNKQIGKKFQLKGRKGRVIKQINFSEVLVKDEFGFESNINVERLSRIPFNSDTEPDGDYYYTTLPDGAKRGSQVQSFKGRPTREKSELKSALRNSTEGSEVSKTASDESLGNRGEKKTRTSKRISFAPDRLRYSISGTQDSNRSTQTQTEYEDSLLSFSHSPKHSPRRGEGCEHCNK